MRTSSLAYRVPMLVASVCLLGGCYTMLRHPRPEVTEAGYTAGSDNYRADCGSCHMAGFEEPLLPNPYPYVADPFLGFYDNPWWYPRGRPDYAGRAPGSGSDEASEDGSVITEGRFVGSRGPGIPTVPSYGPPAPQPSAPTNTTAPTSPAPDSPASPPDEGQQPGREMKRNTPEDSPDSGKDSGDSKDPKPRTTEQETPKDGSGG